MIRIPAGIPLSYDKYELVLMSRVSTVMDSLLVQYAHQTDGLTSGFASRTTFGKSSNFNSIKLTVKFSLHRQFPISLKAQDM